MITPHALAHFALLDHAQQFAAIRKLAAGGAGDHEIARRYRHVALTARTCATCGRLMQIGENCRIRHCCGECRSSAFGLGVTQR